MNSSYTSFWGDLFENFEMSGQAGVILTTVLIIMAVFFAVLFAFEIVCYILESLGIYTMAKRRGIKSPGWAWVPMISYWTVGRLADQYDRKVKGKDIPTRKFLLIGSIILLAFELAYIPVAFIVGARMIEAGIAGTVETAMFSLMGLFIAFYILAFLMSMLAIVIDVFLYIAFFKVYRSCKPSGAVVLLVLSIVFPIIIPFVLFSLRKKDDGYVELNNAQQDPAGSKVGDEA